MALVALHLEVGGKSMDTEKPHQPSVAVQDHRALLAGVLRGHEDVA